MATLPSDMGFSSRSDMGFIPKRSIFFLQVWTIPSLNLHIATDTNGVSFKNQKTEWQTVQTLMRRRFIWIYAVCNGIQIYIGLELDLSIELKMQEIFPERSANPIYKRVH